MKNQKIAYIEYMLQELGLEPDHKDLERPWGGFWVIKPELSRKFIRTYFPEYINTFSDGVFISPKILMVAPGARLSWQYHRRRSELWRVIDGNVGVAKSFDNQEKKMEKRGPHELVCLDKGERHRLIGLDNWAIVAEIWIHSDSNHPSDEDDIIRLQDDFGRENASSTFSEAVSSSLC